MNEPLNMKLGKKMHVILSTCLVWCISYIPDKRDPSLYNDTISAGKEVYGGGEVGGLESFFGLFVCFRLFSTYY